MRVPHVYGKKNVGTLFAAFLVLAIFTPTVVYAQNQPSEPSTPISFLGFTPTEGAIGGCLGGAAAGALAGGLGAIPGCLGGAALGFGGIWSAGKAADYVFNEIIIGIAWVFLEVASTLLGIASSLLNTVLLYGVVQFATYFGSSIGIQAGWTVLRDVGNILLIFSFVFIGIATILGLESYGVKKALPRLLMFAVLLNFSLFAASVVIDTSNLVATSVYQAAGACIASDPAQCANIGLSSVVADRLGVGTLLNLDTIGTAVTAGDTKAMVAMIMITLFIMITATTFLAAAILFIIRTIVLVFILVTSPVGFAGMVVPPLKKFATQWWDTLFAQSFFAPVYLLLMLISLKVAESFATASGSNKNLLAAVLQQSNVPTQVLLTFAILIGFMLAALMSAKKLGAYGASFATKWASVVPKYVGGVAYRRSIGAGAAGIGKAYGAWMGKRQGTTRAGNLTRGLLRGTGADLLVADTLKAGAKKGVLGVAGHEEIRKATEERMLETTRAAELAEQKRKLKNAVRVINDPKASQANKDDAEKAVAEISQKMDMNGLKETIRKASGDEIAAFSKFMSPERFEKIIDSEDVNSDRKSAMQKERFKDVNQNNVKDLVAKDLEQFAKANPNRFQTILEMADSAASGRSYLKEDQLESLTKSDRLTPQLRQLARVNTAVGRVEEWMTDPTKHDNAVTLAQSMNSKEKMKLKTATLLRPEMMDTFAPTDMNAITVEGKLNPTQMDTVKNHITAKAPTNPQRTKINKFFAGNNLAKSLWTWELPESDDSKSPVQRMQEEQNRRGF